VSAWPLFDRFPALANLPRIDLRSGPTPIQSLETIRPNLWIKRDDLTALPIGGNKVRRVATVGPHGSTHALTTAVYARQLGANASVGLWRQEMNPVAEVVAAELRRVATYRRELLSPIIALPWLAWRGVRGDHTIPAGGTSPLGILGHVNAGLELAEQIAADELPAPKVIVVPLGSGGTVAGIALGLHLAGLRPTILAARVVPRIVGRRGRVARLAGETAGLIRSATPQETIPLDLELPEIRVIDDVYGGAYGRPLDRASAASQQLSDALGITLDSTYAGKAFVAALEADRGTNTLFWLTFDSRWVEKAARR
jgi:D-cysteine desulfhydrase